MGSLTNKRVILGVTGGIAAYKSAELIRQLQKLGAIVRVVMTPAACEFITPMTMQALSGHVVHQQLLDTKAEAAMGHIELARWADLILVAPASADFIARLCHGEGSDLLSTLCLASHSPIAIAPAMNQQMWANAATRQNIETLQDRKIAIFGPTAGYQACGDTGPGRMAEPEFLAERAASLFESAILAGKKIVITAGPTREAIDPVRYISNHSSGKMGYALAAAAVEAGAETILISGPVNLTPPDRVHLVSVVCAKDMLTASLAAATGADVFIAAAAVADYRAKSAAKHKIKKDLSTMTIELTKNPDIVATVAALPERPFMVGFAAETQNIEVYARKKLTEKNLDMVVANDVSNPAIGFNSEDNQVTLISATASETLPLLSKTQLATHLIKRFADALYS